MPSSIASSPLRDRVEQRAVVRDEQHRAGERVERRLERLAALEVEVVRRLVEDEEVRARGDDEREREPPPLAARERADRLLVLLPAREEEAAEQRSARRAAAGRSRRCAQSSTRAALVELDLVLGEVRGLDAVAEPDRPRGRLARARGSSRAASSCPSRSGRPARRARRARARTTRRASSSLSPAETSSSSASTTVRPLRGGLEELEAERARCGA